jgi:hypothetical protein
MISKCISSHLSLVLQTRKLANKTEQFWKCDDFSGDWNYPAHRYRRVLHFGRITVVALTHTYWSLDADASDIADTLVNLHTLGCWYCIMDVSNTDGRYDRSKDTCDSYIDLLDDDTDSQYVRLLDWGLQHLHVTIIRRRVGTEEDDILIHAVMCIYDRLTTNYRLDICGGGKSTECILEPFSKS